MGLMLAEPGFHTRAFVEWEEYPRSALIAAQRAGYLAPAPIWDDLTTFDARPFRGAFDIVLAGYPCQPFSQAGQRKGKDDERHLWPDVARVIREIDPEWVFLENVAGHVTLGAETVLRELWEMGYTPAVGLFSAEEVGASHERLRWFCVAHADGRNSGAEREQCGGEQRFHEESGCTDQPVGHPTRDRRGEGRPEPVIRGGRDTTAGAGGSMADSDDARLQGQQRDRIDAARREVEVGPAGLRGGAGLFPPGPADMGRWAGIIVEAPYLAPAASFGDVASYASQVAAMAQAGLVEEAAAEPALRRMADGLALRSRALRLLGNGVVPLVAGYAWRTLAAAHGLRPVDLGAAGGINPETPANDADLRAAE